MMNEKYLTTLEYDKIIRQLAEHTSFSAGRDLALNLRPSADPEDVQRRIRETTEAKALLSTRTDVSVRGARDVRPTAQRAALGAVLQPSELLEVRSTLLSARHLRDLLTRLRAEFPLLAERAEELQPLADISDEIERCLDDDGRVLDRASPELGQIRREANAARERLVERLRRIVTSGENAHFLQEPIVTERNGRYVVPLKTDFKGRIPGIIHDQSSSGATLFIEPLETVELNNHWRQLQLDEQREVERILMALSGMVGREAEVISCNVEALAQLDLAFAKGAYSFALHGAPALLCADRWPTVQSRGELTPAQHPLSLIRARHPLLPRDSVVPIDVYVGGDYTILLLTGPNTGGKTVALKTIGLLAAMSQAGLHIPATDGSKLPVFTGIYADIGDEQSIEQSLSTFSSHMSHIVDILGHADAGSLVLLDELGAGTDPVEGSALAQGIITALLQRRCLAAGSTHYSQLKVFALNTPGIQNASVEFDVETLTPTYHLVIGLPGRSNALAIAKRLGLPEEIVEQARRSISPQDVQADMMLAKIRSASDAAEVRLHEAEERRTRAEEVERELREKLAQTEEARNEVLNQAREQARSELELVRAEIRRLHMELLHKVPSASPASSLPAIKEAAATVEKLAEEMAPISAPEEPTPPSGQKPQVGDTVYVTSLGQTGELLSVSGQEAEVKVGGFRLRTRLGALEFRARPQPEAEIEQDAVHTPHAESPGIELDLRGRRAEEVAPALDAYLDKAYLAGLPWVQIIHGKGMGILKEVVRQFLAGHPLVTSYRPGALNEGGEGVTVVQLQKTTG
jgi:DNA mismatch repair protein MutS2